MKFKIGDKVTIFYPGKEKLLFDILEGMYGMTGTITSINEDIYFVMFPNYKENKEMGFEYPFLAKNLK